LGLKETENMMKVEDTLLVKKSCYFA